MQGTLVSIGLVVRNEAHQIKDCLDNIKEISYQSSVELIVIDNDSTDQTVATIRNWQGLNPDFKCRLYIRETNHMAEARNQILETANGHWVYFTDADCRLLPTSWRNLLALTHQEDKVAFGGGNKPPAGSSFVSLGIHEMSQNWWGHMGSIQIKPPAEATSVPLLSTCNLMVKRSEALACQGFDSDFSRVGEDLSFSHRLRKQGHTLYAAPNTEVLHIQDRGLWKWCLKMFSYGQAQVYVAAKYPTHFISLRGLQFLSVWAFMGLAVMFPSYAAILFVTYLGLLLGSLAVSKNISWARVKGLAFLIISQIFYAAGEVSAIFTLPFFILSSLPSKIPALEKQ